MDKTKNYSFLIGGKNYKIILNDKREIDDFQLDIFFASDESSLSTINFDYLGYILIRDGPGSISNELGIIDSIIYGLANTNIYFLSIDKKESYSLNITIHLQNLSCKQLKGYLLICISSTNDYSRIGLFDFNNKHIEQAHTIDIPSSSGGYLYDTLERNNKIYCAKRGDGQINCGIIISHDNNDINIGPQDLTLSSQYATQYCDTKDCNFINFFSEYIFCCSCNDYIICTRFRHDFNKITDFVLSSEGKNSFLSIINNINYLSILFLNENDIYEKNIYPPNCKNISKEINEKIEINIKEFSDIKKDSNYYLIFEEFNPEILNISLSQGDCIRNIPCNLSSNEMNINFILKQDNLLDNNISIVYTISNEETYSSTCLINLIINQTKNIFSNEDNEFYLNKTNEIINIIKTDWNTEYKTLKTLIINQSNEFILEREISNSEFRNKILKNISSFVNSSNIINGNNF